MPKIILQPIVENSIYHGIKPMEGLGRILVTAQEEGEYLIFMVEDNGAGFNPASPKDGRCVRKGSVGLKNVEERLKLYYGQDCGISIVSSPGAGCTVKLMLKKHVVHRETE